MTRPLTALEKAAEASILKLRTDETQKFVVPLGMNCQQDVQDALERLMLRDWIRLIDVALIPHLGPHVFRVFRVMPEAEFWLIEWEKGRAR
jgi:hypothetical protein